MVLNIDESVVIFSTAIPIISGIFTTLFRISRLVKAVEVLSSDFKGHSNMHGVEYPKYSNELIKVDELELTDCDVQK